LCFWLDISSVYRRLKPRLSTMRVDRGAVQETIYVQIAAYRDPELVPTLRSLFRNARHPERLRVGLCWQRDRRETLLEYATHRQVRALSIPWEEARGVGWARSQINALYDGEDYTLQLDAHHRFAPGWDRALVAMLGPLPNQRSILSTYPGEYEPGADRLDQLSPIPTRLGWSGFFTEEGIPLPAAASIDDHRRLRAPVAASFLAAGYLFTRGSFITEVPYDPDIYILGEEISMAVRAYTQGYDLYHPHRALVWHRYAHRKSHKHHWTTHPIPAEVARRDQLSRRRVTQLLGIERHGLDLGRYGLGRRRTLAQYQARAGIRFRPALPERLRYDDSLALSRTPRGTAILVRRRGLNRDVSEIPWVLYEALQHFDGQRSRRSALASIRRTLGLALDESLLYRLYFSGLLRPVTEA